MKFCPAVLHLISGDQISQDIFTAKKELFLLTAQPLACNSSSSSHAHFRFVHDSTTTHAAPKRQLQSKAAYTHTGRAVTRRDAPDSRVGADRAGEEWTERPFHGAARDAKRPTRTGLNLAARAADSATHACQLARWSRGRVANSQAGHNLRYNVVETYTENVN